MRTLMPWRNEEFQQIGIVPKHICNVDWQILKADADDLLPIYSMKELDVPLSHYPNDNVEV